MPAPILVNLIPPQVVNEQAAYGPLDLSEFIKPAAAEDVLVYSAELQNGDSLPRGLICTSDGILTGIPAKGTEGFYDIVLTVQGPSDESIVIDFSFTIKPSLATASGSYFDELKAQVWQALEQRLPVPTIEELYDRPVSLQEVYYLLERWGTLKIWDAFNLESPGALVPLNLTGASPAFHVFDRGSCLVACPKELFSGERTLADGIVTARAMAREVYKRGWTIEIVGLDKYMSAAWIELQHLGDLSGNRLNIINYIPSDHDLALYRMQIPSPIGPGLSSEA